jgi:hypothetical protein
MQDYVKEQIKRLREVIPEEVHAKLSSVADLVFSSLVTMLQSVRKIDGKEVPWHICQGVALNQNVGLFFEPKVERVTVRVKGKNKVITKYPGEHTGNLIIVANKYGFGNVELGDVVERERFQYDSGQEILQGKHITLHGHGNFLCPEKSLVALLVQAKLSGKTIPVNGPLPPPTKEGETVVETKETDGEPLEAVAASNPAKVREMAKNIGI